MVAPQLRQLPGSRARRRRPPKGTDRTAPGRPWPLRGDAAAPWPALVPGAPPPEPCRCDLSPPAPSSHGGRPNAPGVSPVGRQRRRQVVNQQLRRQGCTPADASRRPGLLAALPRGEARRRAGGQEGVRTAGCYGGRGGPRARQGEEPRGPRSAPRGTGQAKKQPRGEGAAGGVSGRRRGAGAAGSGFRLSQARRLRTLGPAVGSVQGAGTRGRPATATGSHGRGLSRGVSGQGSVREAAQACVRLQARADGRRAQRVVSASGKRGCLGARQHHS